MRIKTMAELALEKAMKERNLKPGNKKKGKKIERNIKKKTSDGP